ncbi:hypothetical protein NUSPORA_02527 [Nucleospora cyclopteri]
MTYNYLFKNNYFNINLFPIYQNVSFDYTKRNNGILRCIHLLMCLRYGLKSSKKIRNHSVQEIVCNENVEIKAYNKIKTNVKIQCNKPDHFIHGKRKN